MTQHMRKWSTTPTTTTPWFLTLDHENEVIYHNNQTIKHGTLTGLVEHLTRHDRVDIPFNETFLTTYPTFISGHELSELLLQRLHIPPPPDLSPSELHRWTEQKQKPIRFRTINILNMWIERYWMESGDECSLDLLRHIHAHVTGLTGMPTSQLITAIEYRLKGQDVIKRLITPPNTTTTPTATPKPVTPKNKKKIKLLNLDSMELARQLTIIESNLYNRIKPQECLNKAWQRKTQEGSCPRRTSTATESSTNKEESGIKAIINHSNHLSRWIMEMILGQPEMKKRVSVLKFLITVADKCKTLNNFATTTTIISALSTAPIYRLHRTWSQVSSRSRTLLADLQALMSSERNFAKYRDALRLAVLPCIPFLGVFLTDLTFLTDGIPDFAPVEAETTPPPTPNTGTHETPTETKIGMINFHKWSKISTVIQNILSFQTTTYNLVSVGEIQEFVGQGLRGVKNDIEKEKEKGNDGEGGGDGDEMYEWSLRVEPRLVFEERGGGMGMGGGGRGGGHLATGSHMSSVVIASMAMR
ncbi:ras GEF [Aspergillus sclerotiicarbonarius CBS 121057]|uniref:Ras GEF n=1 Tax=Aspergillus sclerotiicarbonarius (strain CBS 121057 / IBT 28362) TaxID=1448318 RepID=A0A319EG34_ASPSB|nr:ras GEF [Aspergillus sclerotiicarbonarius CBS 121057]